MDGAPEDGAPGEGPDLVVRPLGGRAAAAAALIVVDLAQSLSVTVSNWRDHGVARDYLAGRATDTDLVTVDSDFLGVLTKSWWPGLLTWTAAGVAFLVWLWRARVNSEVLAGSAVHRRRRGWVVGAWMAPVVNLWFPYVVVADVWRATAARHTCVDEPGVPSRPGTGFVVAWWASFVLFGYLRPIEVRLIANRTTEQDFLDVANLTTALMALWATAGVLAILVIRRITTWQTAPAADGALAATPAQPELDGSPGRPETRITASAPAVPGRARGLRAPIVVGIGIAAVAAVTVVALVAASTGEEPSIMVESTISPTKPASTPTHTSSATAKFSPADLDSIRTDPTPPTASALLPESFTDDNGVSYHRGSDGIRDCSHTASDHTIRLALGNGGCTSAVVGTYVDDAGDILVAVTVLPLSDDQAATTAYDRVSGRDVDDWSMWCPQQGPGSQVCDHETSDARKSGYTVREHRYIIATTALYISLARETGQDDRLDAAARQAARDAGPLNYPGNR
ncbi:DUF4328 domain-containing protein [Amycolatopsis sp. OK19-0408]|uniref:DUF4328 domain-containing protein n=1 Tax=Amycolatopsis iheyensis TaxID=2945988 RepID=A0A9X2SII0_9PSEU|nr:DUF4328 domain-containing protein [Amycolatopsis iheyensis]MCR6483444.1 DUF4328 domain-containing protein [Amycolatopsis iheyensis]